MSFNKIIAVDLDDVLVERPERFENLGADKYRHCTPIQKNIDIVNSWYADGHKIIIYTARGMSQFQGNASRVYYALFELTTKQLLDFGIRYDELVMGKIHYDMIVDDKALNSKKMRKKHAR